jgi:hypothetical protein
MRKSPNSGGARPWRNATKRHNYRYDPAKLRLQKRDVIVEKCLETGYDNEWNREHSIQAKKQVSALKEKGFS